MEMVGIILRLSFAFVAVCAGIYFLSLALDIVMKIRDKYHSK
jgi:hypothetical protein